MVSKLSTCRALRRNPRGKSSAKAVITVVAIIVLLPISLSVGPLLGPIISDIVYSAVVSCATGLICGGNGGGGGGSASSAPVSQPCTSAANACGQTNSGFVNGGSCNATPPSNSTCPTPSIPANSGFYANPLIVGRGNSSTLTWNATNSTACTITGDNGFSHTGVGSGSIPTGGLTQTTTFTLTCSNGDGGPQTSKSVKVVVDPHYQEI